MVGRKIFLHFFSNVCVLLSAIAAVTKNTISSAPSVKLARGKLEAACGGGPAVARLGAPLSAWLIRRTSEAPDSRQSWAGVLGASGSGSIMQSVKALYLAYPQEVWAQGWLVLI